LRKKFGGIEISQVKQVKSLEETNARLMNLLSEAILAKEALQMALV